MNSSSYYKDNIKCDSASNAPKCPLNNGVSIVQKPVGKLSITSTTFLPQVEITLSKWLRVWQQVFERWTHRLTTFRGIWRIITFNVIHTITTLQVKTYLQAAQNGFQLWRTFTPPPYVFIIIMVALCLFYPTRYRTISALFSWDMVPSK